MLNAVQPNSSFSTTAVATAAVPEAFGSAIPTNTKDLLKFIKRQKLNKQSGASLKEGSTSNGITGNLSKERLKMLDEQREHLEMRLMELEDYTNNLNENLRIARLEEISKMEAEDSLSANLTIIFKQYDYDRFKQSLLRQVELRELQEKAEREAKRLAAEERRKAVVERLRLQAEQEERRKREAEEAVQRMAEEKARKEQREQNRIDSDRALMPYEDQLSTLAEQDYREYMERKLWQQREREKLLLWEEEQRKKDIIEEEKRKLRMAELEEKKKKLEILRKQQQQKVKPNESDMKEEQERLNKQLRIQNKAKFISKRSGATSNTQAAEDNNITNHNSETTPNQPVSAVSPTLVKIDNNVALAKEIAPSQSTHESTSDTSVMDSTISDKQKLQNELDAHRQSYRLELETVTSVDDLRERIKLFSQEKRALRLEQRQAMSMANQTNSSNSQTDPVQVLQRKLQLLDIDYLLVEERIRVLSLAETAASVEKGNSVGGNQSRTNSPRLQTTSTNNSATNVTTTSATNNSNNNSTSSMSEKPAPMHRGISAAAMKLQQVQTGTTVVTAPTTVTSSTVSSSKTVTADDLLRDIDRVLRDGQRLCDVAQNPDQRNVLLVEIPTFLVTINQIEKKIQQSAQSVSALHSLGYSDRLKGMQGKLKILLEELQQGTYKYAETKSSRPVTPKVVGSTPASRPTSGKMSSTNAVATKSSSVSSRPSSSKTPTSNNSEVTSNVATTVKDDKDGNHAMRRKSSLPEQEMVERIDQDTQILNSHTVLVTSKTAPSLLQTSSTTDNVADTKDVENVKESSLNEEKEEDEEEDEEEDPEKLPGWQECINSSLFYSAAHHAAYFGYTEVLQFLCKYFDCFIMDDKGRTPLFYAALNNQLQCVAHLLGLDPRWIDVGDHSGDTLLHAAALALNNNNNNSNTNSDGTSQSKEDSQKIDDNGAVLEFLLSCEANPDTANHQGMTPSHIAKSTIALTILAKYKAQLYCMDTRGRLPIWHACFDNRVSCVQYLLEKTPRDYILWPDEVEGDTCLHVAAKQGHAQCIDVILTFFFDNTATNRTDNTNVSGDDCLYVLNKRQYTIAHCAANAQVLRILYEYGMNLFLVDGKEHMPLFLMAFYNRLDCVVYLLDMATSATTTLASSQSSKHSQKVSTGSSTTTTSTNKLALLAHSDRQGDTALHIACVAGHAGVIQVLLLYLSNESLKNKQGLRPSDLARKAGHHHYAVMVEHYETVFRPPTASDSTTSSSEAPIINKNEMMHKIFQAYTTYGARWTKCYDVQYDAVYYFDHVTQEALWEKPLTFDLPPHDDTDYDTAVKLLKHFYQKHNPEKMQQINDILFVYKRRYTELFMTLAQRYSLSDLSMFKNIHFFDGVPPPAATPGGGGGAPAALASPPGATANKTSKF